MTPKAWAALFAVGGIWGASFMFIDVAVDEVSPLQTVLFRTVGGAFVLWPVVALKGQPLGLNRRLAGVLLLLSLVGTLAPFLLITWAQTRIESSTAALLNATMPLFTLVLAAAVLRDERVTGRALAGVALGVGGVALLSGGSSGGFDGRSLAGEGAVILAMLCYAAGNVIVRFLVRSLDSIVVSASQIGISGAIAVALSLAFEPPRFDLSRDAWASLAALAFLGTGVAYVFYYWLIEHAGSFKASLVTYIIPVVGVILGAAVLEESITGATIAGGLLIALGVAVATNALAGGWRSITGSRPAATAAANDRTSSNI